jgi:hypothetical protein
VGEKFFQLRLYLQNSNCVLKFQHIFFRIIYFKTLCYIYTGGIIGFTCCCGVFYYTKARENSASKFFLPYVGVVDYSLNVLHSCCYLLVILIFNIVFLVKWADAIPVFGSTPAHLVCEAYRNAAQLYTWVRTSLSSLDILELFFFLFSIPSIFFFNGSKITQFY